MHRFIALLAVPVFLFVVTVPAGADDPLRHKVWLNGSEDKQTFEAKIDGQKFTTLATLEDYIATLPSGDRVRCRFDLGKIGVDNPDSSQLRHYCRMLEQFCRDHQLGFDWSGIST